MSTRLVLSAVMLMLCLRPALAASPAEQVAARACGALLSRVQAVPGTEPAFLRSYDPSTAGAPTIDGAYTYDNALAVIALVACSHRDAALRIADALLAASEGGDRSGVTGRIRNAYRPGPVAERPVPPMGWWSDGDGRWVEDPYHVGTATGNVAWAALALLAVADKAQDDPYRAAAARLARWATTMLDQRAPAGFIGGLYGYDDTADRLTWKSTEHNTDLAAVFDWLSRLEPDQGWEADAHVARAFVAAQWDPASGHFWVGTTPDGVTPNRLNTGLDAQLWPLLLEDAPEMWRASLHYVEAHHAVSGGVDFNDDRDGIWWEGTAQAALAYRAVGRVKEAERLLSAVNDQFSPGGFIWATSEVRLTTGLALSLASQVDDFYYYRLPHLAPTAWAALAATGWNPFTGKSVADRR